MSPSALPSSRLHLLLAIPLLASGCGGIASVSSDSTYGISWYDRGFEYQDWDDRFPDALEHVFAECADPLVLINGISPNLVGPCQPYWFQDDADSMLFGVLAIAPSSPIALGGPTPPVVSTWGLWGQTCTATVTPTVTLAPVRLYDLSSDWRTHNGAPSLWVDFDFDAGLTATVSFTHSVSCPTASWLQPVANTILGAALPPATIVNITGADLDIFMELREDNGALDAELDVVFRYSQLQTGTLLDDVPPQIRDAIVGAGTFDSAVQGPRIGAMMEQSLAGLEAQVEDGLLSSSDELCSVYMVTDGVRFVKDEDCVPNPLWVFPVGW